VSLEAKDLVRSLLEPNPCKRYSMQQCQAHPWLGETDANSYRVNFDKFLVGQGIKLKPKVSKDLDQYLVGQLFESRK